MSDIAGIPWQGRTEFSRTVPAPVITADLDLLDVLEALRLG